MFVNSWFRIEGRCCLIARCISASVLLWVDQGLSSGLEAHSVGDRENVLRFGHCGGVEPLSSKALSGFLSAV